jgi:hypothetical protein
VNVAAELRLLGIDPADCTMHGKPIVDRASAAKKGDSPGEAILAAAFFKAGLTPRREYHFDEPPAGQKPRLWRFDFAWPAEKVAIEVQGGVAAAGKGHTSRKGYRNDCEKARAAQKQGWMVLPYTTDEIKEDADGIAKEVSGELDTRKA